MPRWWRRLQRTRACRAKYGKACPHLERHSKNRGPELKRIPEQRIEPALPERKHTQDY